MAIAAYNNYTNRRRVLWLSVGHYGHYGHNPRVVTVVTVVTGGRFLVTGHNPRVVTSHRRAICRPSKKGGKEDRKGGMVPPIHNPPGPQAEQDPASGVFFHDQFTRPLRYSHPHSVLAVKTCLLSSEKESPHGAPLPPSCCMLLVRSLLFLSL